MIHLSDRIDKKTDIKVWFTITNYCIDSFIWCKIKLYVYALNFYWTLKFGHVIFF